MAGLAVRLRVRLRGAASLVAAVASVAATAVSFDRGLVGGWWLRGIRHVVGAAIDSVGKVEGIIGFECGWCGDRGSAGV
jgi:hypothetical protein